MSESKRTDEKQEIWVNVSNRTVIRVLVLVVLAFIAVIALKKAAHALLLIFTAFFLALALNAPVHWLAENLPGKRRGNRALATSFSFLVVVIILVGFLALIIPPLDRNTRTFIHNVPHLVQETRNKNSSVGKFITRYNLQPQVNKVSKQLESRLSNVTGTAVSAIGKLTTSAFSVLAILALTFMMLIEGPRWANRFRELLSSRHAKRVDKIANDMYKVVKGYVNGQVLLAAIAAAFIAPGLFLLHISYPAALIAVVFIAALMPLIGHPIGAVIVTLVALFHSPWSALAILIYYILYMQLENYLIQPHIQASATNLSPLLVFMAVIVGVSFAGLFGGLVAIPLMGCLRVAVVEYLQKHDKLEEVNPLAELKDN